LKTLVTISASLPSTDTILNKKGHELGSIFGCLRISADPLLKREAKTLGREALKAGLNLALDVMEGQNVTQAAKSRSSEDTS
jgi:hypothetical protein